ncbi:prophage MuSo2 protein [Roseibium sp. TrichSKD4]|uniref:phage virion morphogenesis protein n=1 Tax=Roseibium sp. TrichSKD4 TaxID=744980 RepID=UPI0001E57602|nr:phage virion morphogenesis protein [Roseibium sp. TrichSKD4]EFO30937.1 prophage MuSo2 protein [Roseibium sp. TrichSKD4]
MSGIDFITTLDFEQPIAAIGRLADLDQRELLDSHGALGASQTKRRIEEDKAAPDGTSWKANKEGTSTLFREGGLADSIDHQLAGGSEVAWGSALVYAAIHQEGGTITPKKGKVLVFTAGGATVFAQSVTIPARPYLGLSDRDGREHEAMALRFIGELL